jgi:microcystin-dependent protein
MSTPFLSEIRIMSFNFAPRGWALCNGQLLPINQNQGLFSLLGTTYGGDGRVNFALPNLQGRVPVSMDFNNFVLGQRGGEEAHTVTVSELPQHNHSMQVSNTTALANATGLTPAGHSPAQAIAATNPVSAVNIYGTGTSSETFDTANAISNVGGSQPHENRQPFLVLNCCIALQGIFPSQT